MIKVEPKAPPVLGIREPKVTFRIVRRCNFDCPGCCTFSSLDRRGAARLAEFKGAVDILDECGFRGVLNISGGETTLHKDLPGMLSYASSRLSLARIALFTNGDWIGRGEWEDKLADLFAGPNVLIRFSHDRQHTEGMLRGFGIIPDEVRMRKAEAERFEKAGLFIRAMTGLGAVPGYNFDFAFKGSIRQASDYLADLGEVPVYLIKLRDDPEKRPLEYGFLAIDVQDNDELLVYPTLGHIPLGKPLGGLETLASALEVNRDAMKEKENIVEQHQWIKTYRN